MINPPKATKAPEIKRKSVLDWSVGTVTDYDSRRIVEDALKSSVNMVLEQNGVLRPRPSLSQYGPELLGEILGEIFECKVVTGTRATFYLVTMQVIENNAYICYCKGEDPEWTKIEGTTYDKSAPVHYVQIGDKVLVMNGVNPLSYLNISDSEAWTITTFNQLADPATPPTATTTGLSGTGFLVYYAVTANSSVGETAASETVSVAMSKPRSSWDSNSEYVTINWDAIDGATGYNVYMGTGVDGEGDPVLYLLQANIDPSLTTFKDDGSQAQEISRTAPEYNSTSGPKTTRGTVVNGRVWLVGDTDNPYYVWYGGDYGHEIDFSPSGYGGGYITVASGTKEVPIAVMPFRRGTGDSTVVVLTQGSNGSGRRFQIGYSTVSYGSESVVVWSPTEDSGRDGTDSPDAVVVYNNSLFYPSRDGFKTTGTMPSLQNILSTRTISATIRDQLALLKSSAMSKAVGLTYENKIYWALPVGSDENNRVWVYHPDQKGAWMTSWYLNVKWMTLYNDNSGQTHFLMYCADGKIYELDRATSTKDDETPFSTDMTSGTVLFSKDGRDWARLIQVVFTLLRPKGEINFELHAVTEDGEMVYKYTINPQEGYRAIGWSQAGEKSPRLVGWSKLTVPPEDMAQEYVDVFIEVDEDVQSFTYNVHTNRSGVDYKMSSVVAEYVPIGIKDLS